MSIKEPENWVNKMTMDCLMNRGAVERMKARQVEKNDIQADTKFYRKRIVHLTKSILYDERPDELMNDVNYAFTQYVKSCVYYFKTMDQRDILQEEYKDVSSKTGVQNDVSFNVQNDVSFNVQNDVSFNEIDENKRVKMDKLMMRSWGQGKPSLDTFVVRNVVKQEPPILPKKKDIDLSNPVLRTKGLTENPQPLTEPLVKPLAKPLALEPSIIPQETQKEEKTEKQDKKDKKDKKIGKKKNIVTIYGIEEDKKEQTSK